MAHDQPLTAEAAAAAAPPSSTHPVHKTLASAANLAKLLPTGTVLAFQTLAPPFSNKGNTCLSSNKILISSLVLFCSVVCFLSTLTDSFTDPDGKLYFGVATFKGLYIFNRDEDMTNIHDDQQDMELSKYRLSLIDFVHAFSSLLVFLAFAFCDTDLQRCLFPYGGGDVDVLVMNLPLAVGVLASFLFMIFPTTRRGIGHAYT